MNEQTIRVFQCSKLNRFLSACTIPFWLVAVIYMYTTPHTTNSVLMASFIFPLIFAFRATVLSTEKVTITANTLVRELLFSKKTVPLSSIRGVKKHFPTRWDFNLIIQTDQSKFDLGSEFSKDQKYELFDSIIEQISLNYPEIYKIVKTEHELIGKL